MIALRKALPAPLNSLLDVALLQVLAAFVLAVPLALAHPTLAPCNIDNNEKGGEVTVVPCFTLIQTRFTTLPHKDTSLLARCLCL